MAPTEKPLVIPVFIPHFGCPHQCAFCNQSIITRQKPWLPDKTALDNIAAHYLQYKGQRKKVELAFFGGNFLGLPQDTIIQLLDMVQPYIREEKIHGIRFSTRPDTITRSILERISSFPISAVEIGVQSMDDGVLFEAKRGHTSMDTTNALALLKEYPFKIGVQVMVGLPGDTPASLFESTRKLAALSPDFARIYPLLVLKGSLMEKWYSQGRYHPMTLENSITLVKTMLGIFRAAGVRVIRMGLQASDVMDDETLVVAGPWHPAFGHLVLSEALYDLACSRIDHCLEQLKSGKLVLRVHPKSVSRLRGNRNMNLKKLKQQYPGLDFLIQTDETISPDDLNTGWH